MRDPQTKCSAGKLSPEEKLKRKRLAARLRQQRCRARKRKVAMDTRVSANAATTTSNICHGSASVKKETLDSLGPDVQDALVGRKDVRSIMRGTNAPGCSPHHLKTLVLSHGPRGLDTNSFRYLSSSPPMIAPAGMQSNANGNHPNSVISVPSFLNNSLTKHNNNATPFRIQGSPSFEMAMQQPQQQDMITAQNNQYVERQGGRQKRVTIVVPQGEDGGCRIGDFNDNASGQTLHRDCSEYHYQSTSQPSREVALVTPTQTAHSTLNAGNGLQSASLSSVCSIEGAHAPIHRRTTSEVSKREAVHAILSLKSHGAPPSSNDEELPTCEQISGTENSTSCASTNVISPSPSSRPIKKRLRVIPPQPVAYSENVPSAANRYHPDLHHMPQHSAVSPLPPPLRQPELNHVCYRNASAATVPHVPASSVGEMPNTIALLPNGGTRSESEEESVRCNARPPPDQQEQQLAIQSSSSLSLRSSPPGCNHGNGFYIYVEHVNSPFCHHQPHYDPSATNRNEHHLLNTTYSTSMGNVVTAVDSTPNYYKYSSVTPVSDSNREVPQQQEGRHRHGRPVLVMSQPYNQGAFGGTANAVTS